MRAIVGRQHLVIEKEETKELRKVDRKSKVIGRRKTKHELKKKRVNMAGEKWRDVVWQYILSGMTKEEAEKLVSNTFNKKPEKEEDAIRKL